MKRGSIVAGLACCLVLLLFVTPGVNAGWRNMEVLSSDFEIETAEPRDQWYAWVEYNAMDNEFMTMWHSNGPLREDCPPGDDYECTANLHSLDARRVSTDGELLGDPIQLYPPGVGWGSEPRCQDGPV